MGLFFRFPDRQWKRGISSGNSTMIDPLRDLKLAYADIRKYIARTFNVSYLELEAAFSGEYYSLQEALTELASSKRESCALSPVFGLSLSPINTEEAILWKHTSMVGTVSFSSKDICIKDKTFEQEILDFLARKGEFTWNLK